MIKKRKPTISAQKTGDGFIGRLFPQTKLPAHVTEEQDWYLDTPDVRLTRVFTVVLVLHVVAVGGILAFKMVEKASTPAAVVDTAEATVREAVTETAATAAATTAAAQPSPETPAASPAQPAGQTAAKDSGTALLVDHPSAKDYQEYCVGAGDTLAGIAQKLKVSAAEILEINNLDSGDNLFTGRWIRVPKTSTPGVTVAAAAPETAAKPAPPAATPPAAPAPAAIPAPVVPARKPAVAEPAPAVGAKGNPSNYQVQKGETLFGIARRFGVKYQDLMAANGIDKAENLRAGQTLRLPKD